MMPVLMAVGCRSIPSTLYDAVRYRYGLWRSLAAHLLWEQGVAGSNPASPTRDRLHYSVRPVCGCSSMVELQPSKLAMRVRFPSPALRTVRYTRLAGLVTASLPP